MDSDVGAFVRWFQSSGGYVDLDAMGVTKFPDSGRGAIALNDIPEGHTIFTLPRALTLSTRTSPLPSLFGLDKWRAYGLHKGWTGLILCMMWEDAWAHESGLTDGCGQEQERHVQTRWGPYMRTLPTTFDTPMFWSKEELEELRGTAVTEKIGRDDAERAYTEQVVPVIKSSPTLFPPSHYDKWYSVDAYHCAGSRILSRSFTVSRWTGDKAEEEEPSGENDAEDEVEDFYANKSTDLSMHANDVHPGDLLDSDSSDDEEDDPSDVAMVPMADILNARWGSENAKLFYEPLKLRMVTTKSIKRGEQIFNTYGDPPNSDLLRRYGHVDLVQMPSISYTSAPGAPGDTEMKDINADSILHLGNPSDIVEIRADLLVHTIQANESGPKMKGTNARIEWWLDEGGDDTFVLSRPESDSSLSAILPPEIISLARLLILSEPEFESAHSKGKLPKGKLGKGSIKDDKNVLEILDKVFMQRERMYAGGSVKDDELLLSLPEPLPRNKRHALIVRLGEKRILKSIRQALGEALDRFSEIGDAISDKREVGGGRNAQSGRKRGASSVKEYDRQKKMRR